MRPVHPRLPTAVPGVQDDRARIHARGNRDDDLSSLNLVEDDYAWVTETIYAAGRQFAGNRIVSVLEGGYDLAALGRSVAAHVQALNAS